MEKVLFYVGEKPYAVWGRDIAEKNGQFLKNYDTRQFEYLAKVHMAQVDTENAQQAATALRTAYGLAQEALFSIIGAALQAPKCVFGWLYRYREPDIELVIRGIEGSAKIPNLLRGALTWQSLSNEIHKGLVLPDRAKEKEIKSRFAIFWDYISAEFMDKKLRNEYNCAKHGLRLQPGGFRIGLGIQAKPNVPIPIDKLNWTQKSRFGSTTLSLEKISQNKDLVDYSVREDSRNWDIDSLTGRIQLIAMSINNVISFLRTINGQKHTCQQYSWPEDLAYFDLVWESDCDINSLSVDARVTENDIYPTKATEVMKAYNRKPQSCKESR
ncbi:hypothetical protein D4R89_13300 [bacterium]|nr:MAG: hypothetical protein D4R89_13300 [bacterium]